MLESDRAKRGEDANLLKVEGGLIEISEEHCSYSGLVSRTVGTVYIIVCIGF